MTVTESERRKENEKDKKIERGEENEREKSYIKEGEQRGRPGAMGWGVGGLKRSHSWNLKILARERGLGADNLLLVRLGKGSKQGGK